MANKRAGSSRFPLLGEPLALDLVNTEVAPAGKLHDLLEQPEAWSEWLIAQRHRLPPLEQDAPVPAVLLHENVVDSVRGLRAASRTVIEAAGTYRPPGSDDALDVLNGAAARAPRTPVLSWRGDGLHREEMRPSSDLVDCLLAALAEATMELVTDSSITTVRACDAPGCILLFRPEHPARRWCSPATCGNRARVARHYQRRTHPGRSRDS